MRKPVRAAHRSRTIVRDGRSVPSAPEFEAWIVVTLFVGALLTGCASARAGGRSDEGIDTRIDVGDDHLECGTLDNDDGHNYVDIHDDIDHDSRSNDHCGSAPVDNAARRRTAVWHS